jgi:hypothetical protein
MRSAITARVQRTSSIMRGRFEWRDRLIGIQAHASGITHHTNSPYMHTIGTPGSGTRYSRGPVPVWVVESCWKFRTPLNKRFSSTFQNASMLHHHACRTTRIQVNRSNYRVETFSTVHLVI